MQASLSNAIGSFVLRASDARKRSAARSAERLSREARAETLVNCTGR
jgi:hypothetical protein